MSKKTILSLALLSVLLLTLHFQSAYAQPYTPKDVIRWDEMLMVVISPASIGPAWFEGYQLFETGSNYLVYYRDPNYLGGWPAPSCADYVSYVTVMWGISLIDRVMMFLLPTVERWADIVEFDMPLPPTPHVRRHVCSWSPLSFIYERDWVQNNNYGSYDFYHMWKGLDADMTISNYHGSGSPDPVGFDYGFIDIWEAAKINAYYYDRFQIDGVWYTIEGPLGYNILADVYPETLPDGRVNLFDVAKVSYQWQNYVVPNPIPAYRTTLN